MSRRVDACRFLLVTILMLATVATVGTGFAQSDGQWGLIGGLNFAGMGGDMEDVGDAVAEIVSDQTGVNWSSAKGRLTGMGFGAYYALPTAKSVGLQIEGHYMRRGVGFDLTGGGIDADLELRVNYFEIPVLLRYAPAQQSGARFILLAGPVIGFKTGDEVNVEAAGNDSSVDAGDLFKSTSIGALGGLGLTFGESPAITLQARYYLGLTNAIDDETLSSSASDFGLFAGVEFPLRR